MTTENTETTEELKAVIKALRANAREDSAMIDRMQAELSAIHRWVERNNQDGFIDSLTYTQNLERVTDSWYDRLDRMEADGRRFVKERDEARELCRELNDLVAYGLGQNGSFWSQKAMRQAREAIQNAKSLEETK